MHSISYRSDIDGLRAIAVLAVVIFHYFPKLVPGGFIGVDVFFVISGYLITGILIKELSNERFSIYLFYARRIRRIFPALIVVFVSVGIFGWYVLTDREYVLLGKHILAGASFVSNIILWGESGYFDIEGRYKPFLNLWSLGIEEQFYFIWPVILFLAKKKNVGILGVILLIFIISFFLNIELVADARVSAFYMPYARAWELILGATLIVIQEKNLYRESIGNLSSILSVIGFLMLSIGFVLVKEEYPFPGWLALIPCVSAMLIILSGNNGFVNKIILSNPIAIGIGLISYPLYLWHWPILAFAHIIAKKEPSQTLKIILICASFLLAWATYFFIEKKIRYLHKKKVVFKLIGLMLLLCAFSLLVYKGIIKARNSDEKISKVYLATQDWIYPNGLLKDNSNGVEFYKLEAGKNITVMFGDSHMQHYSSRVITLKDNNINTVYWFTGGCFPIGQVRLKGQSGGCDELRREFARVISNENVKNIVFSVYWSQYFFPKRNQDSVDIKNGDVVFVNDSGFLSSIKKDNAKELVLEKLSAYIKDLSEEKKVYLILENPKGNVFDPLFYLQGSRFDDIYVNNIVKYAGSDTEIDFFNKKISEKLAASNVELLNPKDILCDINGCKVIDEEGNFIYRDSHHLRSSWVEKNAVFIDQTVVQ